jgi:hypothetical protein
MIHKQQPKATTKTATPKPAMTRERTTVVHERLHTARLSPV